MPPPTVAALIADLRRLDLADAQTIDALTRQGCADAPALLRALVERGGLTPYQANRLAQGKADELALGPYVILDRLGAGGTGRIHLHYPGTDRPSEMRGTLEPLGKGKPCPVRCLAFSPDGKTLASGDDRGGVFLWPMPKGEAVKLPAGEGKDTLGLAFSPDGKWLAASRHNGQIVLWDVEGMKEVRRWQANNGLLHAVAFLDENTLVSAGWDTGRYCTWDVRTGKLAREPVRTRQQRHNAVVIAPHDSGLVLVGSDDGVIRLWRPKDGRVEPVPGPGHEGPVNALTFSREGDRLFSGGWDEVIRVWRWPGGEPAGRGRGTATASCRWRCGPTARSWPWAGSARRSTSGTSRRARRSASWRTSACPCVASFTSPTTNWPSAAAAAN